MTLVADPDPLSIPLTEDLTNLPFVKNTIITALWGENIPEEQYAYNEPRFIAYLKYYENECRHSARTVPFSTHRQTLDAIIAISDARQKPFDDVRNILATSCPTFATSQPESQTLGVTLCLRLWLMINIRDRRDGGIVAGVRDIEWNDSISVASFIQSSLPDGSATFSTDEKSFDDEFNVLSLKRLAGVRLVFTDNLADHLVFHRDTRRLHIFRCGYFLALHLSISDRTTLCSYVFNIPRIQLKFHEFICLTDDVKRCFQHGLPARNPTDTRPSVSASQRTVHKIPPETTGEQTARPRIRANPHRNTVQTH